MTYLLDTSAIIGWLERSDSTLPALLESADTALYHPVTLGELRAGIERATTNAEREMRSNTLNFTTSRLQAIDEAVLPAEQFGLLTARFSRKISHNDYWILASAIASARASASASSGVVLATEDTKFFDLVDSHAMVETLGQRGWVRPGATLVRSSPITSRTAR